MKAPQEAATQGGKAEVPTAYGTSSQPWSTVPNSEEGKQVYAPAAQDVSRGPQHSGEMNVATVASALQVELKEVSAAQRKARQDGQQHFDSISEEQQLLRLGIKKVDANVTRLFEKLTHADAGLNALLSRLRSYQDPKPSQKITAELLEEQQKVLLQHTRQMRTLRTVLLQLRKNHAQQYKALEPLLQQVADKHRQANAQLQTMQSQLQEQLRQIQRAQQHIVEQVIKGQLKTSHEIDGAFQALTQSVATQLKEQSKKDRQLLIQELKGLRQLIKTVCHQQGVMSASSPKASVTYTKALDRYVKELQEFVKERLERGRKKHQAAYSALIQALRCRTAGGHRAASALEEAQLNYVDARGAFEDALEQASEDYEYKHLTLEQYEQIKKESQAALAALLAPEAVQWLQATAKHLRGQGPAPTSNYTLTGSPQGFRIQNKKP